MSLQIPGLYIAQSYGKARAVFAGLPIEKEDLIELCPIIHIPSNQLSIIHETVLHDYYFLWGPDESEAAIALGFGSLYNHSNTPNAYFEYDYQDQFIRIIALASIAAQEEICINYTDSRKDIPLWFKQV